MEQEKKEEIGGIKGALKEAFGFLCYLVIVLLFTFLVVEFVGQRTVVSGSSMEATLTDGDNLIVDKLSYRFREPERFDIIVFEYQKEENTFYIKRVIGLPGETVQIAEDGTIFINGEELEESYGKEVIKDAGIATEPIQLQEDEYFVLGDNRNGSRDSRDGEVGPVKKSWILGKAWLRVYPLNSFEVLDHGEE